MSCLFNPDSDSPIDPVTMGRLHPSAAAGIQRIQNVKEEKSNNKLNKIGLYLLELKNN
ncbi:MAG: hypothetical protein N838_35500 [Thiohalocapsa sp. PB-PSB1]|jgi:hypothetical protein|nr:MAG: hypothetical protein N838_35500 [Thiohalocapsa sp. PB-PSB1]